jgi:hypothetical protein
LGTIVEPLTSRINRQASLSSRFAGLAGCVVSPHSNAEGRVDLPPGAPFVFFGLRWLPRCATATPFATPGPETTDHDFLLTCSCGTEQRMDEMALDETGPITLYECKRCTKSIVGVMTDDPELANLAPQGLTRWEEKAGHHLRGYIIGARVDVALRPEGTDADMLMIPATRYFFTQYLNL